MRNITNSNTSKVFVNTITASSPLVFSASSSSASNIALTGLSGFGSAGQVIKVNSSGDGLEYGGQSVASQWVLDTGSLRPISNSIDFVELKRTDTGQVGFKLTNSSYNSEFKQFNDNTIITTANGKLQFTEQDIKIINYLNRDIIQYVNSNSSVQVGNTLDDCYISRLKTVSNTENRILFFYEAVNDTFTLGNTTDIIKLLNVDSIKNTNDRIITSYTGTTLTIGNATDLVSIVNGSATLTLPTSTDTLVGRATTDTLTNKTLTSPNISTIVNTGTLTLPTSTDTLVGKATTDTLTNKTLTSPNISTIVNTGTLTLPTSTDTLVGKATTDTLTNKTLTSPKIDNIKNSSTRNIINYSGNVISVGSTITDSVYIHRCEDIQTPNNVRFYQHETNSITIGNDTDIITFKNVAKNFNFPTTTNLNNTIALTTDIPTALWENNSTIFQNIQNIDQDANSATCPKYIKIQRNSDTTDFGYWIRYDNGSGTIYNSYMFQKDSKLNIQTDYKILRLYDTTFSIENSNSRIILKYINTGTGLQLNNTTDILSVYNCKLIKSKQDRNIVDNSTDNLLQFGNTTDQVNMSANRYEIRDGNSNILLSSVRPAANMTYNAIVVGKGAGTIAPEERPLILMNSTTSPTFRDCRFQLRNVNTSGGSNAVIELFQNTIAGYKGAYIYQGDGEGSLYLESTFKTIFRNYGNSVAEFNSNNALKFLQSTSNITGSTTSTHPHNTTNRMNNIYCNEVVCQTPISQQNMISYKAFQSKYDLATIQGLGTDVPGPNRIAMLELGGSQVIGSANNAVYPVMRINAPVADAEWYMYLQANTDGDEYNGFAFSDSTTPDYFLEFDSGGSVNVYQQLRATAGLFTTGSKTFRIKHPIKAEADKDKVLYHNCVEAPRCDNLYSGKIQLKNGKGIVNLDNNEWYKMTSGTFNKLNKDLRVYVNNNDFDNWDLVKGKIEGNKLIIVSNNPKSNVLVDWMVIGTRQDQEIIDSDITDDLGNLIIEHIEVENENFKMKKRNVNFNRKEKKKYNKFHSLYKSFSNRLNTKTKIDNGLNTARQLIKNNPNKKKSKKPFQPFMNTEK
jgi:hypothetical protein